MSNVHRLRPAEIVTDTTVTITWEPLTFHYIAICQRCAEFATGHEDQHNWLHEWAEDHTCDAELAALLAEAVEMIRARRAA